MIPVLQQMFAPAVQSGPASAAENADAVSDVQKMGATDAGAANDTTATGVFAAVFGGQTVVKPDPTAKDASSLVENAEISAEAWVDGGAIFALRLPNVPTELTDVAKPSETSYAINAPPLSATNDANVLDHTTLAEGVLDQVAGVKTEFGPAVPQQLPAPDAAQVIPDEPMLPANTIILQGASMPAAQAAAAGEGEEKRNATSIDQKMLLAQSAPTIQTALQPAAQPMAQMPIIQPIFSNPMAKSMAESMFHTQIDAQDVATIDPVATAPLAETSRKPVTALLGTMAVLQADMGLAGADRTMAAAIAPATLAGAIKTLNDPDETNLASPMPTDDAPAADLSPTAATALLQDKMQSLAQNLGAASALASKAEVAPAQTPIQPSYTSAPQIAQHLAPHIATQILPHSQAAKTGPIEVLLNPAELGHLRFEIHQKGDHVQVVLSAERPETLELLRKNGEQLAAEFRNSGFAGASFSFGQWGRSSDGQAPASFVANAEDDFGPVVLTPVAKPPMAQDNSRNLNLRL